MQSHLTEKEIEFCEHFYTSVSMIENLIPENEHSPQTWKEDCDCIHLYDYQHAMLNYASCLANDSKLTKQENIRLKKGSGDLCTLSARNIGKSFLLKIDLLLSVAYKFFEICLASFDDYHLKKVASPIADYLDEHIFWKIFHKKGTRKESVQRNPLNAKFEHGVIVESANEHVKGNNPGEQFHAKHYDTLYFEEFSYTSPEGTQKRIDSGNALGYIFRPSGIPDLDVGSPLGKILNDKNKQTWLCQLPQYVRSNFTQQTYDEKVEEYNGATSVSFALNVEAKTVEGAFGFFDMERVRENSINNSRRVKFFEIGKETFTKYDEILASIERLSGTEQNFICADVGYGAAPTEIIIVFYSNKKYKYIYNIALFRLTQLEQAEIFKWLYDKLGGAFVAVDATGEGGTIIDELFKLGVSQEHLLKVKFNENIEVGFEYQKDEVGQLVKDSEGNSLILQDDNGNPVMKMANTEAFSFEELEKLLYSGECDIAWDDKFITQFTNVICKQIGLKRKFDNKGANHLVQAFQVWSVCRFFNEFNILKNQQTNRKRCWSVK